MALQGSAYITQSVIHNTDFQPHLFFLPYTSRNRHIHVMTDHQPPQSTFVEIEAPTDVATPIWPHVHHRTSQGTGDPTSLHTPWQVSHSAPGTRVQFASSPLGGSTPIQSFTGEQKQQVPMQLCTPSSGISPTTTSSPVTGIQYELPQTLPTPGREINQLTTQVQYNWDNLHDFMTQQERAVTELTTELKSTSAGHQREITRLAVKMEEIKQQISTTVATNKQQAETESDQTIKAMKLLMTEELKIVEGTLMSEVRFLVQQLQAELQQDVQAVQRNFQKTYDELVKESKQLTSFTFNLSTNIKDLQTKIEAKFDTQVKGKNDISDEHPTQSTATHQVISSAPAAIVKSDHIKLTFPTFGNPADDPDPLLYLTRCQDFIAVHPLSDTDILATFRTVLSGTARDWWEVTRTTVKSWNEFQTAFLSAFLAEDYEDELAERVRKRMQGEHESIRDFAFSYRALCKVEIEFG